MSLAVNDKLELELMDIQSINSYSYVKNNPLKYIDITGEKAISAYLASWASGLRAASDTLRGPLGSRIGPFNSSAGNRIFNEMQASNMSDLATAIDPSSSSKERSISGGFVALNFVPETRMLQEVKVVEGSLLAERSVSSNIGKINNIIRDHLTPKDYSGLNRDVSKNPVWSEKMGRYWDHFNEVFEAQRGLNNAIQKLENIKATNFLNDDVIKSIDSSVKTAKSHVDRISKIIKSH